MLLAIVLFAFVALLAVIVGTLMTSSVAVLIAGLIVTVVLGAIVTLVLGATEFANEPEHDAKR